jgi:hypothetical protein
LLSIKKIISIGVAALLPLAVYADSLLPKVPKAKKNYNDQTLCVEPVDEMREHHMTYILHQRNDTLRKGDRSGKHSLKECIDCHNAPADDGKVASADSPEHFCSSCHTYTAVSIDCFSCHSDKPENTQYRHSLSELKTPDQHLFATQDLNQETLKALTVKGEGQQ